jgi:ABC-type polysaccharide/polyol phosphate export permease
VRPAAAVLGMLWSLASLAMSYAMVTGAFVAKTAMKEGLPAQAALLLGGIGIEVLSFALIWQCMRMLRRA